MDFINWKGIFPPFVMFGYTSVTFDIVFSILTLAFLQFGAVEVVNFVLPPTHHNTAA